MRFWDKIGGKWPFAPKPKQGSFSRLWTYGWQKGHEEQKLARVNGVRKRKGNSLPKSHPVLLLAQVATLAGSEEGQLEKAKGKKIRSGYQKKSLIFGICTCSKANYCETFCTRSSGKSCCYVKNQFFNRVEANSGSWQSKTGFKEKEPAFFFE